MFREKTRKESILTVCTMYIVHIRIHGHTLNTKI